MNKSALALLMLLTAPISGMCAKEQVSSPSLSNHPHSVYASLYSQKEQIIAAIPTNGSEAAAPNVKFECVLFANEIDISHTGTTGRIVLTTPGVYMVNYSVLSLNSQNALFQLFSVKPNGVLKEFPGAIYSHSTPILSSPGNLLLNGQVKFRTTKSNQTIVLKNASFNGTTCKIASVGPNGSAWIDIYKLD